MTEETGGSTRTEDSIPTDGRVLGIDFGTKRVGIAITDVEQRIASPLHNYERRSKTADAEYFQHVAQEHQAVGVVVGLPVHMSGDEGEKAKEARQYGKWLRSVLRLPVVWQDERLTTAKAEALLLAADLSTKQRKSRLDKLSAQILLTAWIDGGRKTCVPGPIGQ